MIRVTVQGINSTTTTAHHYNIAGHSMVVQHKVDALEKYSKGEASEQFAELLANHREIKTLSAVNAELRYHDLTLLAGEAHRLRYWRRGRRGQIDIDGSPSCYIDFKDKHIHVINGRDLNAQLSLEIVLGPAYVIMLAYFSTYCMHASAVSTEIGTIVFLAESGVGKSTLAEHQDDGWNQISDDILPLKAQKGARVIEMHADFPQLKLNHACVAQGVPKMQELNYLIRLKPESSDSIEFSKMSRKDCLLQVIRHTVAAKLFSQPMMQKHASFARKVSLCVPMAELSYPRDWDSLADLRQRIIAFCQDELAKS